MQKPNFGECITLQADECSTNKRDEQKTNIKDV